MTEPSNAIGLETYIGWGIVIIGWIIGWIISLMVQKYSLRKQLLLDSYKDFNQDLSEAKEILRLILRRLSQNQQSFYDNLSNFTSFEIDFSLDDDVMTPCENAFSIISDAIEVHYYLISDRNWLMEILGSFIFLDDSNYLSSIMNDIDLIKKFFCEPENIHDGDKLLEMVEIYDCVMDELEMTIYTSISMITKLRYQIQNKHLRSISKTKIEFENFIKYKKET